MSEAEAIIFNERLLLLSEDNKDSQQEARVYGLGMSVKRGCINVNDSHRSG